MVLGDQTLPFDNLLISGLSRRGISGHLADLPLGTDATAFSVRDSSLAGFYGGFGVGDSSDLVSGGIIQSHPIASAPKALTLQAGFVTGSSPGGLSTVVPYPGGNGSFPPNTPLGTVATVQSGSGNAWVIGANSEIPGTTLHLNGQYASSRFDFPGAMGQSDTRASDDAYSIGLGMTQPFGKRWNLALNAAYQDIGTYFTSLANPTLSPGPAHSERHRHGERLRTRRFRGRRLHRGQHRQQCRDRNRAQPAAHRFIELRTDVAGIDDQLARYPERESLLAGCAHATTPRAPVGSEPTASDVVNDTLGFNFAYTHFSWQAGFTGGKFRDYTGQQDDTDTFGPTGGFNVSLGGKGFLSANLQLLDAHDLKNDTHTLDRNYL